MDFVALSPRIPALGETILGTSFLMVPGGKGANQAVAAAKLGAEVFFVAKVGDDIYGAQAVTNLNKAGVNTDFVTKTNKASSGIAFITVDSEGNNNIVVIPGANYMLTVDNIRRAEEAIKKSGVIVCQLEIPIEIVEYTSLLARKWNISFILDPAPAPKRLSEKLLANTTILTPNETEAESITGIKIENIDYAYEACEHILDRGVETVVLTMGAKGLLLATTQHKEFFPQIKVEAVDSTAAGDAFTGSFAYFIAQGKTASQAAQLANYVAALSVTQKGAQPSMPTMNAVMNFIQKYQCQVNI